MRVSDFDFELPPELIATHPPAERRASRLLQVGGDELQDRHFADLPALLREGDLLVFNDTRVIKARLRGHKESGGKVELLIERVQGEHAALVHIKASKSPRPGTRLHLASGATATVAGRSGALFSLTFDVSLESYLAKHGEVPLPPYLGRDAESADDERYQTVYARQDGAVAAPTAGLHFDKAMLSETLSMGVTHAYVTLHVGAGTFQALREEHIAKTVVCTPSDCRFLPMSATRCWRHARMAAALLQSALRLCAPWSRLPRAENWSRLTARQNYLLRRATNFVSSIAC